MAYKSGMEICPYDKSHEIERERMQFHLVKCAKNHPGQEMVSCAYNNLHRIPKPELPFHHQTCPDKKKLEVFMHYQEEHKCPVKGMVDINDGYIPDDGENWDNEPPQPSALDIIQKKIEEKPVLRALKVSSKAKKKTFHLQERQRMNILIDSTEKLNLGSDPQKGTERKTAITPDSVPSGSRSLSSYSAPSANKERSMPLELAPSGSKGRGWSTKQPEPKSLQISASAGPSGVSVSRDDEFPSLPLPIKGRAAGYGRGKPKKTE